MGDWVLIKDGVVFNVIVWNGPEKSPMEFEEGVSYVEITGEGGVYPSIGWLYDGVKFSRAPLTEEEIAEQNALKIYNNISTKSSLMAQANVIIAPLQDAVDLDDATEEELSSLKSWKQYRVALNRIDANTHEEISWPKMPAIIYRAS